MLYRIHAEDGDDLGQAVFGYFQPGEDILISVGGRPRRMRVTSLVSLEEEDESPFEGLLMVEPT